MPRRNENPLPDRPPHQHFSLNEPDGAELHRHVVASDDVQVQRSRPSHRLLKAFIGAGFDSAAAIGAMSPRISSNV
jgi:hypothetical protein